MVGVVTLQATMTGVKISLTSLGLAGLQQSNSSPVKRNSFKETSAWNSSVQTVSDFLSFFFGVTSDPHRTLNGEGSMT